jgi:hypothetical protein
MKERRQRLEREREIAEQRCRERRGGWRTEHDSPELTDWLNRLVDDDGVVYFLGLHQLKFILPLVDYSDEEWTQELILGERATRTSDLGTYFGTPVLWFSFRSPIYHSLPPSTRTTTPIPTAEALAGSLHVSVAEAVELVSELAPHDNSKLYTQARAAAGALLHNSAFISERHDLRHRWCQLPREVRPRLPLRGSVLDLGMNIALSEQHEVEVQSFAEVWEAFRVRWRLKGMVTWDLPDPLEFHPKDVRFLSQPLPEGIHAVAISPHLSLKSDGRIAPSQADENRKWRQSMDLEIVDRHPVVAANLANYHFVDVALAQRRRAKRQPPLSHEAKYRLFGQLFGVDPGNVRKHLLTGKRLLNR